MRFKSVLLLSLFVISLSACASHHPLSPEDQAEEYAKEAMTFFSKKNYIDAARRIDAALLLPPTGGVRVKELFTSNPKMQDYYLEYLENIIDDVASANEAGSTFGKISTVVSAGLFSENQQGYFFTKLKKVVTEGNINGSVPFELGDASLVLFPELKSPSHQQIIVNRTITKLQDKNSGNRSIPALIEYVQKAGVDSVEGKRIESLLPTMNIKRDELETVAEIFPVFAKSRREEITTSVFLQVKNGDRLLTEDLLKTLRGKVNGVDWVASPGERTTTLVVERVRNDEKIIPERSETITYAQHEVNILSAVMLMPRNASYLYEVVSGGAEIEYGYVITASTEGKSIYDEIVRGKVGGEYRRCQNSRIQNVFGGVSSAGFTANDDMRQRCSGPVSPSMDQLRNEVFEKIADSVLKIPPIKVAQDN